MTGELDKTSEAIGSLTTAVLNFDKRLDDGDRRREKRDKQMFDKLDEIKTGVQENRFKADAAAENHEALKVKVTGIKEDYVSKKRMKWALGLVAPFAGIIGAGLNKLWPWH